MTARRYLTILLTTDSKRAPEMPADNYKGSMLVVNIFDHSAALDFAMYIKQKKLLCLTYGIPGEHITRMRMYVQGTHEELAAAVKYGRWNFNTKYFKVFSTKKLRPECFHEPDDATHEQLSTCSYHDFKRQIERLGD